MGFSLPKANTMHKSRIPIPRKHQSLLIYVQAQTWLAQMQDKVYVSFRGYRGHPPSSPNQEWKRGPHLEKIEYQKLIGQYSNIWHTFSKINNSPIHSYPIGNAGGDLPSNLEPYSFDGSSSRIHSQLATTWLRGTTPLPPPTPFAKNKILPSTSFSYASSVDA